MNTYGQVPSMRRRVTSLEQPLSLSLYLEDKDEALWCRDPKPKPKPWSKIRHSGRNQSANQARSVSESVELTRENPNFWPPSTLQTRLAARDQNTIWNFGLGYKKDKYVIVVIISRLAFQGNCYDNMIIKWLFSLLFLLSLLLWQLLLITNNNNVMMILAMEKTTFINNYNNSNM